MQQIGEMLSARGPNDDEVEIRTHVYELAHAWKSGELSTSGVRSMSTGKERFTAVRFSTPGYDKDVLLELIDALIAENDEEVATNHGMFKKSELGEAGYIGVADHEGKRVLVSPMYHINGLPTYPDYSKPPGEEKQAVNEARDAHYRDHRRKAKEEKRMK